jgi:hypothetical protein
LTRVSLRQLIILTLISVTVAACSGTQNDGRVTPRVANNPTQTTSSASSLPNAQIVVNSPASVLNPLLTETPEPIEGFTLSLPYAIPASCAVTALQGPFKWLGFPAFWLVSDGIRAGLESGVLYAGDNKVMLHLDQRGTATMTGERLDGVASPPVLNVSYLVGAGYVSGVSFSEPGCWNIRIDAGAATLNATVYVYPSSCRLLGETGTPIATPTRPSATAAPCSPPA